MSEKKPEPDKKLPKPLWTIVQHSGWGHDLDPAYQKGLQSRQIFRESQAAAVRGEGGQLFEDIMTAQDYCMDEEYPVGYEFLTPAAQGTFSEACFFDGLALYLPVKVPEVA